MWLIEIKDEEGNRLGYWREETKRGFNRELAGIRTVVEGTRYTDEQRAKEIAAAVAECLTITRGETITCELYQFAG